MKKYFCDKCNAVLPKGKIVCSRCGYDNPELISVLREHIKRQILIKRIILVVSAVALVLFLHVNLLFPWQAETRKNKRAIINYAKDHYPGAKIVDTHYESAELDPWSVSIDTITFKWNDIEFSIRAEQGEVIADGYLGIAR